MLDFGFFNMDCMDGMKQFPDKYFDLAIVDPPYGIGGMTMNYTKSGAVRTHGHCAAKRRDYRKQSEWDIKPNQSYFDELFRVSQHQIIWGGNYFADMIPPSKSFICWDKRCNDSMRNDFSDCEYAWTDFGVARMFRFVWNGMIQGNMKNKEERFHPTQKPVALYEWCLNNYAKQGYKILDTHVGSASSLIACHKLGFDYVGFELDPDYFKVSADRLESVKAQTSIFDYL
jgi:site-specific DNA-methyltransferase (adenine-specific)